MGRSGNENARGIQRFGQTIQIRQIWWLSP